jgi:HK97 family phage prohead protease
MTVDQLTTKTIDILIRKADAGGFTGYGATWWTLDNAADVMCKGAFADDLDRIVREVLISNINHEFDEPLGKVYKATEDDYGLLLDARYSDVEAVKDTRTLINDRVIQWLSVTFATIDAEFVTPDELTRIWMSVGYQPSDDDLRRLKAVDIIRVVKKAKLREVTPASMPINHKAVILTSKSESFEKSPKSVKHLARRAMQACDTLKSQDRLQAVVDVLTSVAEHAKNKIDGQVVPPDEAVAEPVEITESEAEAALQLAIAIG